MPYVKHKIRNRLDKWIFELSSRMPFADPGALNYAITRIVLAWLPPDPSYTDIALATGVLENAKQELYRRLAAPYEDSKVQENGDIDGYVDAAMRQPRQRRSDD